MPNAASPVPAQDEVKIMDQLHLPPDLYKELRDRANSEVSAWLSELVARGAKYLKSSSAVAARTSYHTGRKQ
jgi:hypothetical protein